MIDELSKQYNPKETEDKWYKFWEEHNYFLGQPSPAKKPFCIVIPPPNVTGILHMGHALNNTIQDILIRYQRMKGLETLWMPGTDHAGIATQNVVEKAIAKEGLKRQDLGREEFVKRVWQWKEQYGLTIIKQLKKLGASCDWSRTRFTMDEQYSRAVIEVFVGLYEKGLIYRGSYIINWCPRCQTALSDEEAPHREIQGNLYYLRYPLKEEIPNPKSQIPNKSQFPNSKIQNYIVVATTRPETMLGDTAVAVNPKDKRYKKLIGKTLILPLINREIKIIADTMVDTKFGTGAVKVTPAHDPNDYTLGKKHRLEFVNVMHPDGRMNENAGDYNGLDRFKAREVILEDLKEKNLLEKIQPHQLSAGHCYRCHTIIEPYLSRQWFVKMKPLARPAIEAVKKGRIKFHPKRWRKVYLNWMENIRDWCISRQIWWGHRLPVYYCKNCQKLASEFKVQSSKFKVKEKTMNNEPLTMNNPSIIVSRIKPQKCPTCGSSDIYQDEDVLDTWFSSWLWPFATFVNEQDLKYFYPTSVLVTAAEIIFFWVARMIMAGLEFAKDIPFRDVYIHGTVRDITGKKMSKSLGNIIDPLDIINAYGADALRFSLISITASGQDVFLSQEKFQQGRNFANKIWNASRFILMNLEPSYIKTDLCVFFQKENFPPKADQPTAEGIINRWILSRFYSVLKEIDRMLAQYRFNEAANTLYGFFWHEFCDWYLEMIKPDIKNPQHQVVMYKVLEKLLRVLHPFMPFVTEEVWQRLQSVKVSKCQSVSIMIEPWPHLQEQMMDKKTETKMKVIFELITNIRNIRQELDIPAQKEVQAVISTSNKVNRDLINALSLHIQRLSGLSGFAVEEKCAHLKSSITAVIKDIHLSLPLEGIVDLEKERLKIKERIDKIEAQICAKKRTLSNKEFLAKAPPEVVENEKEKTEELTGILKRLKAIKDELR